jgi:hypothetical protein
MNSVQAPDNDLKKTPKDELIDINQAIFLRLCIHEEEICIFGDMLTTIPPFFRIDYISTQCLLNHLTQENNHEIIR